MKTLLSKIFRLHPEETSLALAMAVVILLNALARQINGILAISGLITDSGVNSVLVVWLIDYVIILLSGGLQTLIVDRVDRLTLMRVATVVLAIIFVVTRMMFTFHLPSWLNYGVLYILSEQQFVFFPLVFWVLANDIFDMAQAKRLFPFIASWSFVGVILGSLVTAVIPGLFQRWNIPTEEILLVNVVIYLISFLVLFLGLRSVKIRPTTVKNETFKATLNEGIDFVRNVASFRYLMIAIMILAACDVVIEFRFLAVSDLAFPLQADYQRFYSLYRLLVTLAAFILQSTITGRILERLTLKNTFFFFPAIVVIGGLGMMVLPGVGMAIFAMGSLKLIRDTVDESSRRSFEALVPEERRGRVSTFMNSYLPAIGTILSCLLTGAFVWIGQAYNLPFVVYIYLGITVIAGILATVAIVQMSKVYESSLLNWRLKRRQRGTSSVLDKLDF
jgi:AAA family ATP:ADP antiporter